jgi:hypothetical protein
MVAAHVRVVTAVVVGLAGATFARSAGAELTEATRYALRQGSNHERNAAVGGGVYLGAPGMFGLEAFASAVDTKLLPGVYLDAVFRTTTGIGMSSKSDRAGTIKGMTQGQLKVGFAAQGYEYGTTNVALGADGQWSAGLQDVPVAKAVAGGPFVGLDLITYDWTSSKTEKPEKGVTPTLMGGVHFEQVVNVGVIVPRFGYRERKDRMAVDLAATYGLTGPRKGTGALVQMRWYTDGFFGLSGYFGADVGGVLFGADEGIFRADEKPTLLSTFTKTVRASISLGLAWEPRGLSRLPKIDPECVRREHDVKNCSVSGEAPLRTPSAAPPSSAPAPAPSAPAPAPTPAPAPAAPTQTPPATAPAPAAPTPAPEPSAPAPAPAPPPAPGTP